MVEDISKKVEGELGLTLRRNNYPLSPEEFSSKVKDLVDPNDVEGVMGAYRKLFTLLSPQNS